METIVKILITSQFIFHCNGVNLLEQLEQIARRFDVDPSHTSVILGAPSMASHLPEAEPILPGHTLIRPARGMLKSSVKFPHRDLDNGAGVYGNINNLGIRYDGKQDRVMYTGFRRMPSKNYFVKPEFEVFQSGETHISPNKRNEMTTYVPVIVLKKSDVLKYLLSIRKNFVKNGYRKRKYEANKVQKLLKEFKNFNKGNLVRTNIMRRNLTPLGFIIMETPDEEVQEVTETSYEESANTEFDNIEPQQKSDEKLEKKKWFWDTKDAFNHIKINPAAPEQSDLMPNNLEEKTRDWSFFNKEDFRPYNEMR